MTHDSLCPDSDPNRWVSKDFNGNSMSCRCEEYARVREEERAAALDEARKALTEALNGLPIKWTSDELFPAVLTIHRVFDQLAGDKP